MGLTVLVLFVIGNGAMAEVIRFDFTGTVTNRFNNGLPDPSDIFGLTVNVNDPVTGSFTIDTSAAQFGAANGTVAGAVVGYTQTPPADISVSLAGGVFSSDGSFASTIANDFQNNAAVPPIEQFTVVDGATDGFPPVNPTIGDMILLDGTPETARVDITFTDNDATAFNSTMLPTTLDLGLFELAEGTIRGTRPSGQANPFFYHAAFRVDSITATAVPEPSAIAFLACCGAGAVVVRRRRCLRHVAWASAVAHSLREAASTLSSGNETHRDVMAS